MRAYDHCLPYNTDALMISAEIKVYLNLRMLVMCLQKNKYSYANWELDVWYYWTYCTSRKKGGTGVL